MFKILKFEYVLYFILHILYKIQTKIITMPKFWSILQYLKYIHNTWQLSPKFPISDFSRAFDFVGPEGFCGSLRHNKGPRSAVRGV